VKPYEIELRQRLIDALNEGKSLRTAAASCGINPSTATRWRQRLERSGALAADPAKGRRPLLVGREDWLAAFLAENPRASVADVHSAMTRAGAPSSYATVRRYMIKQGFVALKPRARQSPMERK